MPTRHRQMLDSAVRFFAPQAQILRGAAICITGASGFLAANLVVFLGELNRAANLNLKLYANARRSMADVPLFKFLDLSPEVQWTKATVEETRIPDVEDLILVHTASFGSPRDYLREPMATYSANTQGLINLMRQRKQLRQFVYFSSAEIYGQPPDNMIPTPETYVGGLNTLAARSIYGESKRMAEVLGTCLGDIQGTPFTAIRPWNVYGPGQRLDDGRVPIEFIHQAKQNRAVKLSSNGSPTRAFCYVWDAIIQVIIALGHTAKIGAFNVGNDKEEISMLDLARRCAMACGISTDTVTFNPAARVESLQRCAPDVSRILSCMSPAPTFTPLDTGLGALTEWYDFIIKK
jgi:nucleoside-diphosphate-sugar epimerase